jgi:hypothetical protein
MFTETPSSPLTDLDRYLVHDFDVRTPDPSPDARSLEVEMKIRLGDGNQVTVTEHVATMAELGGALERARVRLALSFARVLDEGFAPGQAAVR